VIPTSSGSIGPVTVMTFLTGRDPSAEPAAWIPSSV
jgi:hypothetical protein